MKKHFSGSVNEDYFIKCLAEITLFESKNRDYASGGSTFGNFERVSQILSLYPNLNLGEPRVVALVYMLKQLDAIMWHFSHKHELLVEDVGDRLKDVSVYCKIISLLK